MNITQIKPQIRYVGVNDRTTTRFEALWSLPYGVSYNSYLVLGEKVALIDTVEEASEAVTSKTSAASWATARSTTSS